MERRRHRTQAGTDYAYLLDDDDRALPDPRSAWQPDGVHGCSRIYDHAAYPWTDQRWTGRQLPGGVLYELHVGTFTPEGTFDSAIDKLDHLVDLGVDLIELLPVNAFNGEYDWGYDGVCWFAPHHGYGGPDGLKRLVDAAHGHGLGVILDVVYNHLGPSGAYAPLFAPYLAETSNTWGRSVNLDGPHSDEVRRYIVDNVVMWLRDYHSTGCGWTPYTPCATSGRSRCWKSWRRGRGALHPRRPAAVADRRVGPERPPADHARGGRRLRPARAVERRRPPRPAHAAHRRANRATTPTSAPWSALADVLTGAFFHAGGWSSFRAALTAARSTGTGCPATGSSRTCRTTTRSATGPPATGSPRSLSPGLLRVGATLLLTAPFTPMLFMGEEWGAGDAVAVLHQPPRAGAGRRRGDRPPSRVRRARLVRGRRAGPAGSGDLRRAPSSTGPSWTSRNTARCSTSTGG